MASYWKAEEGIKEAEELAERFPTLRLVVGKPSEVSVVTGILNVCYGIGYSITLELPADYPRSVPVVKCDPREVPRKSDRHVNEATGEACLCVRSEYRMHWPRGRTISDFIQALVFPFLMAQFYYDTHGHWPPAGGRSHGKDGIIEAYREMATRFGGSDDALIERLMRSLARRSHPKGHELCPCGSGCNLRNCHRNALEELRKLVDPRDAALDLADCYPKARRSVNH